MLHLKTQLKYPLTLKKVRVPISQGGVEKQTPPGSIRHRRDSVLFSDQRLFAAFWNTLLLFLLFIKHQHSTVGLSDDLLSHMAHE